MQLFCPCLGLRVLFCFELFFSSSAERAYEIFRYIFPKCSGSNTCILISFCFIINIPAYQTYIFCHDNHLSFFICFNTTHCIIFYLSLMGEKKQLAHEKICIPTSALLRFPLYTSKVYLSIFYFKKIHLFFRINC